MTYKINHETITIFRKLKNFRAKKFETESFFIFGSKKCN